MPGPPYAGYLHGLLGLVARSRLFFLLLLTIRTIQILVGISSVRFLVENAGSMHFVAFCKLLGLPFKEPFDQYAWDLPSTPASSRGNVISSAT